MPVTVRPPLAAAVPVLSRMSRCRRFRAGAGARCCGTSGRSAPMVVLAMFSAVPVVAVMVLTMVCCSGR